MIAATTVGVVVLAGLGVALFLTVARHWATRPRRTTWMSDSVRTTLMRGSREQDSFG
jgi:hypothetical protein